MIEASESRAAQSRSVPLALLMVLIIGLCWGSAFPLNRMAITSGVPFAAYVFLQSVGAAVLLLIAGAVTRQLPRIRSRAHVRAYFALAFFGIGIPYYVLTIAADKVPAGVLGLVQTIEPLMTYLFVMLFALERFHWLRMGGLVVGLVGILLVLVPRTSLPSPDMVMWVVIGFSASLSWAFWTVVVVLVRPPQERPVAYAAGYALFSALITGPAVLITDGWWFFKTPFGAAEWSVIAMTLINAFLFYFAMECIRYAGVVLYSIWAYVGTLTAIGLGILVFGEQHSGWIWAAVALLFIGTALVTQGGRFAKPVRSGH